MTASRGRSNEEHPSSRKASGPVKVCLQCRAVYRTRRDTCPADGTKLIESDLAPGSVLAGKYRIEEEIGRGGMGVVYRAVHIIMAKTVAIKVISPLLSTDPKFLEMFKTEARAVASFHHPTVLTVHDFGQADGRYSLVLELVEGKSLRDLKAEEGRLTPERALSLLLKVCDAVNAAHAAGILHLDLKGENIIVTTTGDSEDVRVLDFGLARLAGGASSELDEDTTIGTVGYMAPEQIMGYEVSERTDVYALGVLAFELLAGAAPFHGSSKDEILNSQLQGRTIDFPKSPALKAVPKSTIRAIRSAIDSEPRKRPASVADLAAALKAGLDAITKARHRFAGRHDVARAKKTSGPSLVGKALSAISRLVGSSEKVSQAPEGMVLVPVGEFIMGTNHGNPDEGPAVRAPLGAFYIQIVPVTNRDYARFTEATDHPPPSTWKTISYATGTGDLPVTGVTWQDAADYAAWWGGHLPSEAQWEKAARGTGGRVFPWGNKWDPSFANWGGNPRFYANAKIRPVGTFPEDKSPYGCLDMAGNVMEWTDSWYKPYGPTIFKSDDFGEKFKVVRSGGFMSLDRGYLRCSHRSHARPEEAGDIGFRCAKNV